MRKACVTLLVSAVVLVFASNALGATGTPFDFLLGSWSGTGSGDPGQGTGSFVFAQELDRRIITRRAHSEYPATPGRPAVVHDDLLIVYADGSKAIYFDNEGHVIHYHVVATSSPASVTFLSTDPRPSPLFKLTYVQASEGVLDIRFEISNTGSEADLKTYLEGRVTRLSSTAH